MGKYGPRHIIALLWITPILLFILSEAFIHSNNNISENGYSLINNNEESPLITKKIKHNSDFCDISKLNANSSNEVICLYIKKHCDVKTYQISRDYYCSSSSNSFAYQSWFAVSYISMISVIFLSFGLITSNHLYPNLETTSAMLSIPSKLTGLILLAIGNAIPDISTLYNSISANATSLAIGELLGSCNFNLGVILGSMGIMRKLNVSKEAFVKDFLGFSSLVLISLSFLFDSKLRFWECFAMIALYVVYIWYAIINVRESNPEDVLEQLASSEINEIVDEDSRLLDTFHGNTDVESDFNTLSKYTRTPRLLSTLETVDLLSLDSGDFVNLSQHQNETRDLFTDEVQDKEPIWYLLKYMNYPDCHVESPVFWKTPLVIIFNLIIPTFPKHLYESETVEQANLKSLRKIKIRLFHIQMGLISTYLLQGFNFSNFGLFFNTLCCLSVWISLILIVQLICFLEKDKMLVYLITLTGFLVSIFCIDFLSFRLVMILQNIALIFNISESLLGLTILSLCNSFSDLVTNLTLTHLNLSLVAINTSFGSILIYFGIGIGFNSLLVMWKQGRDTIDLNLEDPSFFVSSLGVVALLLVYLIVIPLNNWCIDWRVGSLTISIWVIVFLGNIYVS